MPQPHDPVSAISEAEASGQVAEYFADIREIMGIPFLTSIWRTLVGIEQGLEKAWEATRPLMASGQPAASRKHLISHCIPPIPNKPFDSQEAGLSSADIEAITALLDCYNRSNGLNFLALSGLIAHIDDVPVTYDISEGKRAWPPLPPVLSPEAMTASTWKLLLKLNQFGAQPDQPGMATLWRHLAYWPAFLEQVHDAFTPLQQSGDIGKAIQCMLVTAQAEGERLAHFRPAHVDLPRAARAMITHYVQHPGLVVRMVVLGHSLAAWIKSSIT